jgi:predicted oxidoreductase (fatty acid repression mutant protein)
MELWVDDLKKHTATSSKQLNTPISLSGGSNRFAVLAIKTAGQTWESTVNATVKQVLENGSKPAAGTQPGKHRDEPNAAPVWVVFHADERAYPP